MSARGSECPSTMTRGGWRIDSLMVASIQTSMDWTNKQKNLEAVKDLVAQAAQQQAQLILLPEAVGGYSYSKKFWEGAEPQNGPTTQLLCWLGREHRIHVGASILEARGEHFYNVFVMAGPNGEVLGEVFKQAPCALECLYFNGLPTMRGIECPALGIKVGVAICYDNQLAFAPNQIALEECDLLLMPHCAMYPDAVPKSVLKEWTERFQMMPKKAAVMLGIPAILANHGGPWGSPVLGLPFIKFKSPFMGMSQIVLPTGEPVCEDKDGKGGKVLVGEVVIPPKGSCRKAWAEYVHCQKGSKWSAFNSLPEVIKRIFVVDEFIFSTLYHFSWGRRAAALRVSGDEGTYTLHYAWACIGAAGLGGYIASRSEKESRRRVMGCQASGTQAVGDDGTSSNQKNK